MTDDIGQLLDQLLAEVTALRGPKLLLVCLIAFGYGVQKVRQIDNGFIPVILAVLGICLAPFLVAWPAPGDMDPALRFAEVAAWAQVLLQGFLLGVLARVIHHVALKKIFDSKLGGLVDPPAPPQAREG